MNHYIQYTPRLIKKILPYGEQYFKFLLQTEFGHDLSMRLRIRLLEIRDQLLPLGNHLEESATGMEILLVFLEVEGQALDLLGKEGNLILRGSRVLLVPLDFLGDSILLLVRQRHSVIQPYSRTSSADVAPKYATKKLLLIRVRETKTTFVSERVTVTHDHCQRQYHLLLIQCIMPSFF